MSDLLDRMLANLDKPPPDKIGVSVLPNRIVVSTVGPCNDCAFETALVSPRGAFPVERYQDRESAIRGHAAWLAKASGLEFGDKIVRLGYPGREDVIPDKVVTL